MYEIVIFFSIIQCPAISDYTFEIFNRCGQQVFTTQDQNEGWNGTYNNKPEPIDTYVYVVHYQIAETGLSNTLSGNLTLLK
ncbi:MAG: gliding motility-associated C-terminal domain-containing protein [Chitinophagales bacterium]|nr:gliding motility-associated C-terminal domain-containing protein [Chitinophagales bacterium]